LLLEFPEVWQIDSEAPEHIVKVVTGSQVIKRYMGVEKVKNASRVGLLYAASSLKQVRQMREYLSEMLRTAGKQVEGFCVGKLTEAKLGNFVEIDCFVVLGCAEFVNSEILPRARDFHCPLVTAWEVMLACGVVEWDGFFDCQPVPLFAAGITASAAGSNANAGMASPTTVICDEDFMQSLIALEDRGWAGLVEGEAVIPPAIIEPGLDGIPARYRSEPNSQ
jgi:hypothetical protein